MKGIIGKKLGMTQIFTEQGSVVPVTVLEAGPCVVVQKRTKERDGYEAVQLGFGHRKERHVNKPMRGHFEKAKVPPLRTLREFRLPGAAELEVGEQVTVGVFEPGERVDVSGISKGKGFAGPIKRHHFGRGPMAHGSKYHRGPGSLGASSDPSRVFKGRKMAGRMGGKRVTVQGLEVVRVDPERNLLLVKGSVPGNRGATLEIRLSGKNRR